MEINPCYVKDHPSCVCQGSDQLVFRCGYAHNSLCHYPIPCALLKCNEVNNQNDLAHKVIAIRQQIAWADAHMCMQEIEADIAQRKRLREEIGF